MFKKITLGALMIVGFGAFAGTAFAYLFAGSFMYGGKTYCYGMDYNMQGQLTGTYWDPQTVGARPCSYNIVAPVGGLTSVQRNALVEKGLTVEETGIVDEVLIGSVAPALGGTTLAISSIETLQRGSVGPQVRNLQVFLNTNLGTNLVADGSFGLGTENAVKMWQAKYGLVADGKFGSRSLTLARIQGMQGSVPTSASPVIGTIPVGQVPILAPGSVGPDVVALQNFLNTHIELPLSANGVYDTNTAIRVANLQATLKLQATGVVDSATLAAFQQMGLKITTTTTTTTTTQTR